MAEGRSYACSQVNRTKAAAGGEQEPPAVVFRAALRTAGVAGYHGNSRPPPPPLLRSRLKSSSVGPLDRSGASESIFPLLAVLFPVKRLRNR